MDQLNVGLIGYGLIGRALEAGLTKAGHKVIIFDNAQLSGVSGVIDMDVTSSASVSKAIETIKDKKIKIDAIINCSYPRTPTYGRKLEDVTAESFNENVSCHLGGYFNVMQQFGFYFKSVGGGSIISFSSIYGVVAPRFDIYEGQRFSMPVEYAAVKSAIVHLSKYMAKYFKETNVRYNVISPGGVFSGHDPSFVEAFGKYSLSQRGGMLMPEDLVSAALFLVSDASKFVNGQNIVVDDGWSL